MTDLIESALKTSSPNGVVLFSKTYCHYSTRAKNDLASIGVSPVVIELDQHPDGREIQAALFQMTGQKTVPSAWVAGKHIGGSDDVRRHVQKGLLQDENAKIKDVRQHAERAGIRHWFLIA